MVITESQIVKNEAILNCLVDVVNKADIASFEIEQIIGEFIFSISKSEEYIRIKDRNSFVYYFYVPKGFWIEWGGDVVGKDVRFASPEATVAAVKTLIKMEEDW